MDFADAIFYFFAAAGFQTVGFNLEETEGAHSSAFGAHESEAGLFRGKYKNFMSRLFERWQDAGRRPRIREFESMSIAIGDFLTSPGSYRVVDDLIPFHNIVVTREGDISTFSPELASGIPGNPLRFSIGNAHRTASLDELAANHEFQQLAAEIGRGVARCRSECEYFPICDGGTASNKFYEKGTFDCAETVTCTLNREALAQVVADGLRKLSAHRGGGS